MRKAKKSQGGQNDLDSVAELFCRVDDFYCELETKVLSQMISQIQQRRRKPVLSESEIITIVILFQTSGYRTFKQFYVALSTFWKYLFPRMPSYNRFVDGVRSGD